MKKIVCFLLAAVLLMTSVALADTQINPQEKRGIKLQEVGLNEVEEGISPTTGLTLSTLYVPEGFTGMAAKNGRYLPVLVQIGNDDGGVGHRAPWGAVYADIVYETLLHRNGSTRLTFLFNDLVPSDIGPVRSARLVHVWIREEWGAAFLYHGRQEYDGSNVIQELSKLGHPWIGDHKDPMIFDNNSGEKKWNDYFYRRSGLVQPYNVGVSASGIVAKLVPADQEVPNHTFKFTDETPDGDDAMTITVKWRADVETDYNSTLVYDIDSNSYLRYMGSALQPWVDKDEGSQIAFANVIVQFVPTTFNSNRNDAPVQRVTAADYGVAEGNADFFMAGKHVAGYWKRDSVTSRTVYYGPDGNEISLQRGKTLIIIFPDDALQASDKKSTHPNSITYSDK